MCGYLNLRAVWNRIPCIRMVEKCFPSRVLVCQGRSFLQHHKWVHIIPHCSSMNGTNCHASLCAWLCVLMLISMAQVMCTAGADPGFYSGIIMSACKHFETTPTCVDHTLFYQRLCVLSHLLHWMIGSWSRNRSKTLIDKLQSECFWHRGVQ